jgi:3'-phosphoadenosine 5'-phosphosulfate sulfotransferase (PAPS reductase)/FAD synthetase
MPDKRLTSPDPVIDTFLAALAQEAVIAPHPFVSKDIIVNNESTVEITRLYDQKTKNLQEIYVSSIFSFEHGKGAGSRLVKLLIDAANKTGISIRIEAKPYGSNNKDQKPLTNKQLFDFYKRYGFEIVVPQYGMRSAKEIEKYVLKTKGESLEMLYTSKKNISFEELLTLSEPNQIKIADGSNTTFDTNSPDIRYDAGGITKTDAFKKWFGNSKAVDADGNPLIVYHGTPDGRFTTFDKSKFTTRSTSSNARAFFFTPSKWYAEAYSESKNNKTIAIYKEMFNEDPKAVEPRPYAEEKPCYLKVENPMYAANSLKETLARAIQNGHDGVIVYHDNGEIFEIAVFESNQIKDATGINTTFDPSTSDIYFKEGGEIPTPDLNPIEMEKIAKGLKIKYGDDRLSDILNIPDDEPEQRKQLIEWIKTPENNVKIIIAFSGGKDSVAMVLYTLFVLKIPKESIELWHHDVDGDGEPLFDWACTRSYCKKFADHFGLKILFSFSGGGILREIYRTEETVQPTFFQKEQDGDYYVVPPLQRTEFIKTRRKFPAVSADLNTRWCSWIAKIGVMVKAINNTEKYKNCNLVVMTGERRLESTARSKYKEMEEYRGASKTRRAVQWRPIIDWTVDQVWDIFKEHKVQPHPCYELGWGRCSCQLCIFSSPEIWATINEISPEKVKRIADIEQDLGFSLYSSKSKGEYVQKSIYETKVLKGTASIPDYIKERWLLEALGEFVSPIRVEEWVMPLGAFSKETSGAN